MSALHSPDHAHAERVSLTLTIEAPRSALDVIVRLRTLVEQLDRADLLLLAEVARDLAENRQRARAAERAERQTRERPTVRPLIGAEAVREVTGGGRR